MHEAYHRLSAEDATGWLQRLQTVYDVWAPAVMPTDGRHSDQPVVGYRSVTSFGEIVWDRKTFFSPKEVLFPIRETLFRFLDGQAIEARGPLRPVIVFLRPCDIHGFLLLDDIFLRNGGPPDYYYERRRRQTKFFMIECTQGFDSCFCVSMRTNRTDDYAAALRVDADGVSVALRDSGLMPFFGGLTARDPFEVRFPVRNAVQVRLPDPAKIDETILEHEMWKEYSRRCIGCGRCNTSCPSCSCFSMQDTFHDTAQTMGERRRVWAGCHLDGFTDMAGGHAFRKTPGARMRFKVLHKVHDFRTRFGRDMCVGCGRCDDVCPEYISFSKCVNRLTNLVGERTET